METRRGGGGTASGGPRRKKARKRILTWYFDDVAGTRFVHRMYIETEVVDVKKSRKALPALRADREGEMHPVRSDDVQMSLEALVQTEPIWADTEAPAPPEKEET